MVRRSPSTAACLGGPCPRGLDRYAVKVVDDTAQIDITQLMKGPPRVATAALR